VLTILATREGTSITIVDNERDGFDAGETWGQRLFFNQNGERASLTGQRKSDYQSEAGTSQSGEPTASTAAVDHKGLNMVLMIQVPLKQKKPMTVRYSGFNPMVCYSTIPAPMASDVEEAVIGHGKVEGPFTEIDGLDIQRDDRYPVRVTVQFYQATSNGVVSDDDMATMAAQLNKVYQQADYVGSLVVEGPTGRPTEYTGTHIQPPDWWDVFWQRHLANTGQSKDDAIALLKKLLGDRWQSASLNDAEIAYDEAGKTADDG
jgi:hypothetical protein